MLYRLLLCFLSVLFIIPINKIYATDSTGIRSEPVTPPPACVTRFFEAENNNTPFTSIASPANGGVLCPGKYDVFSACAVSSGEGCGGGSCGWASDLYDKAGNHLASRVSHDGCVTSHGNVCENQPYVIINLNSFVLDTNINSGLFFNAWIEDGYVHDCSILAIQKVAY